MPAQALFLDEVHSVVNLRYAWSEDGTVLLTLDCDANRSSIHSAEVMTYGQLIREILALCPWQQSMQVAIGTKHAIAEVLTIYHAFESATSSSNSLMLVSTPPDEYFEAA